MPLVDVRVIAVCACIHAAEHMQQRPSSTHEHDLSDGILVVQFVSDLLEDPRSTLLSSPPRPLRSPHLPGLAVAVPW